VSHFVSEKNGNFHKITTNMDSTRDGDDEQVNLLVVDYQETILLAAVHCHAQYENRQRSRLLFRSPSLFEQRLQWDFFCTRYGHRAEFKRHMRMTFASFNKLLSCLRPQLQVDNERANSRGGAILPELCLYICLRYLAGGSYSDIPFFYRHVSCVVVQGNLENN
jgi:hypothetical protein